MKASGFLASHSSFLYRYMTECIKMMLSCVRPTRMKLYEVVAVKISSVCQSALCYTDSFIILLL